MSNTADTKTTALCPDQQRLVDMVIERAEQACRYVFKHQDFPADDAEYARGFEAACSICEGAIRAQVMRHIAKDISK